MGVIFETIHGSHLYGLNHAGSDVDLLSVYDFKRPKASHKITNELDHVRIGVFRFLDLAYSGAHQSVEALFSPYKEWTDERWRSMLENVRFIITGVLILPFLIVGCPFTKEETV